LLLQTGKDMSNKADYSFRGWVIRSVANTCNLE